MWWKINTFFFVKGICQLKGISLLLSKWRAECLSQHFAKTFGLNSLVSLQEVEEHCNTPLMRTNSSTPGGLDFILCDFYNIQDV